MYSITISFCDFPPSIKTIQILTRSSNNIQAPTTFCDGSDISSGNDQVQAFTDAVESVKSANGIGDDDKQLHDSWYYHYCWNNAKVELMSVNGGTVNANLLGQCEEQLKNQCVQNKTGGVCYMDGPSDVILRVTKC